MDQSGAKGLRGSSPARIDDKGRLKVPTIFRGVIQDMHGPDVFVTSLTGECVRIYPLPDVARDRAQAARRCPAIIPSRLKFLDRVNYYGQTGELDGQGRVVIPPQLRDSASIVGDVRVFGRIDYLEVWNDERFLQKLQREPWTDEDGLGLSAARNLSVGRCMSPSWLPRCSNISRPRAAAFSSTAPSATAGTPGRMLEAGATTVIGFDRDPAALAEARDVAAPHTDRA